MHENPVNEKDDRVVGEEFTSDDNEDGDDYHDSENDNNNESEDDDNGDEVEMNINNTAWLESAHQEVRASFLPKHVRCASHTLNLLATTDFLKAVKCFELINKKHKQSILR